MAVVNSFIKRFGWFGLIRLVFYPLTTFVMTPVRFVQTLRDCRVLLHAKWEDYSHFITYTGLSSFFYSSCALNLYRFGRGGHSPYVGLGKHEVFADAKFIDRAAGDYRLSEASPLIGKGLTLPMELDSYVLPCDGNKILTRAFAKTHLDEAPDPGAALTVHGTKPNAHYRLQPLPRPRALVDLDACEPGTPGLNRHWRQTGEYPRFRTTGEAESVPDEDWVLAPENLLADASFDEPLAKEENADAGPWHGDGRMQVYQGMLAANLGPNQRSNAVTYQQIGKVRANAEYLLSADMTVRSAREGFAAIAGMYLAAGDPAKPMGDVVQVRREGGRGGSWNTYDLYVQTGEEGADANVGQTQYVVLYGRVEGPEGAAAGGPVVFPRWDDVWLLSGPSQ